MQESALEPIVEDMKLEDGTSGSADTPEVSRFRSLPQSLQRRLLLDYPRLLATAMHEYSDGVDCEAVLMHMFENSSEMLAVRNTEGDNPVARALLRSQEERAARLVDLADRRNPSVLDSRSQWGESLLMLSTMSSDSSTSSDSSVMLRLLSREPSQLHRLYDNDGRNFLHHCTLEESICALENALKVTLQLIEQGRLTASQVSAAIHMNDRSGSTPMHIMAYRNRRDMLSQLLEFGRRAGIHINLDERQHRGRRLTPLMVAVSQDAVETAELLLENGADPSDELDTEGQSAEYMAEAHGTDRMRCLFFNKSNFDYMTGITVTPVEEEPSWLLSRVSIVNKYSGDLGLSSADSAIGSLEEEAMGPRDIELLQKLLGTVNSLNFLNALRKRNGTLDAPSIANISQTPVEAAFSYWLRRGITVPRSLVNDVMKEIGQQSVF